MIERIGRYLEVDETGHIVPDVAFENIQPHWRELIANIISFIQENRDGNLVSLYVRGSVPRGLAVDYVSDLDLIFIAGVRERHLSEKVVEFKHDLLKRFPFCTKIEWYIDGLDDVEKIYPPMTYPYLAMLMKTQALHLWGEDIVKDRPKVKPGLDTISHSFNLEREWRKFPAQLAEEIEQEEINSLCGWMGRRILRAAFEIAALNKPLYTRDLYLCYETAADEWPEMAKEFMAVLEVTINQNTAADKVIEIFSPAAEFLISKIHFAFPTLSKSSV